MVYIIAQIIIFIIMIIEIIVFFISNGFKKGIKKIKKYLLEKPDNWFIGF